MAQAFPRLSWTCSKEAGAFSTYKNNRKMKQDEQVTEVKFAWEVNKPCFGCKDFCPAKIEGTNYKPECKPGKNLIAIFPEIKEGPDTVSVYTPNGEHSSAHVGYLKKLKPAKPEDYGWLKSFLEKNYGYKF